MNTPLLRLLATLCVLSAAAGAWADDVDQWVVDLRAADAAVRRRAAEGLSKPGAAMTDAAARALVGALGDSDAGVRRFAAATLHWVGDDFQSVVRPAAPTLRRLVTGDPDPDVRRCATYALQTIDGNAPESIDALAAALDDESPPVRAAAARALGWIGPPAAATLKKVTARLADKDTHVRAMAAFALGGVLADADIYAARDAETDVHAAINALVRAIGDAELEVRRYAARSVGHIGPAAGAAEPALVNALGSDAPHLRSYALFGLSRIPLTDETLIPVLVRFMEGNDKKAPDADVFAAQALGGFSRGTAVSAVPSLLKALASSSAGVRAMAACSLGRIGDGAGGVVSALTLLLGDDAEGVRRYAAYALGELGEQAREAGPTLARCLLADVCIEVRRTVAYSLGQVGGDAEASQSALMRALAADPDAGVRRSCVVALDELARGAGIERARAALLRTLREDPDENVRSRVADAMRWHLRDQEVARALASAFHDKSPKVRARAAHSIGWKEGQGAEHVPALIGLLGDADADVRAMAAFAFGGTGPKARDAVPALMRALGDKNAPVRGYAARSLGHIGPAAREAAPALTKLKDDADPQVSDYAEWALEAVGAQ